MKKNNYFKRYLILIIILALLFSFSFLYLNKLEEQKYNININYKLNNIIELIKEKYPLVKEEDIIYNFQTSKTNSNFLTKYGYDFDEEIMLDNIKLKKEFLGRKLGLIIIFSSLMILIFISYKKRNSNDIDKIVKKLEKINNGDYKIDLKDLKEDELSILKDEVAKTTIMLRSMAEASLNDKVKLKDSLEDISHQLKTPLTSICIMLDNLLDPDISKEMRNEFLNKIKREITNLNFLINSLLKLSKFDVNAITFYREKVKVTTLIKEAILNVNSLSDLKNITINFDKQYKEEIYCDKRWQIEALTNILKNALEHSNPNSQIDIGLTNNNLYLEITITDYGKGMDDEDLEHLFERFYKGKNASKDSIGIGLALAKSIILEDKGKITCTSKIEKGTTFNIKYFY